MHHDTPENQERTEKLREEFKRRYDGEPIIVRAPGRVNLIGEHTDYNDGFVLPIAIDHDVRFAVAQRHDRMVRLYSVNFDQEVTFDLDRIERDDSVFWNNYVRGMAKELLQFGCLLYGMDGVVEGNVPVASGLSSSAAMEIAAAMAFCTVSKAVVEAREMAILAQSAENNFMGVHVGIMDQFVSRLGHAGHALFIDCRSLEFELVPVNTEEYCFVVTNSLQSRELAASAYNKRREQCEAAVAVFRKHMPHVRALRDVTMADLQQYGDEMDPYVCRRANHVISENARTLQAVNALKAKDLKAFGELMNDSHDSLRDDYQVSSPALDALVYAARDVEGCLGSRLTGAGFGGCTVSLVHRDRVEAFKEHVAEQYRQACNKVPEFYVTQPAAGAGLVEAPPQAVSGVTAA